LDRAAAGTAQRDYEEAVRDRCNPAPVVSVDAIPHGGANGVLLAINISPAIATPVGVKVQANPADGFGGPTYMFPMRVTTQTIELQPGQLAMFMLPQTRRAVVLLSQLKKGDALTLQFKLARQAGASFATATFDSVEPLLNRVRFELDGQRRDMPLDAVESIWQDAHGTIACVAGNFVKDTNHNHRWIFFHP
jgi:hypothetical protein